VLLSFLSINGIKVSAGLYNEEFYFSYSDMIIACENIFLMADGTFEVSAMTNIFSKERNAMRRINAINEVVELVTIADAALQNDGFPQTTIVRDSEFSCLTNAYRPQINNPGLAPIINLDEIICCCHTCCLCVSMPLSQFGFVVVGGEELNLNYLNNIFTPNQFGIPGTFNASSVSNFWHLVKIKYNRSQHEPFAILRLNGEIESLQNFISFLHHNYNAGLFMAQVNQGDRRLLLKLIGVYLIIAETVAVLQQPLTADNEIIMQRLANELQNITFQPHAGVQQNNIPLQHFQILSRTLITFLNIKQRFGVPFIPIMISSLPNYLISSRIKMELGIDAPPLPNFLSRYYAKMRIPHVMWSANPYGFGNLSIKNAPQCVNHLRMGYNVPVIQYPLNNIVLLDQFEIDLNDYLMPMRQNQILFRLSACKIVFHALCNGIIWLEGGAPAFMNFIRQLETFITLANF
jgi:hypothetical protein